MEYKKTRIISNIRIAENVCRMRIEENNWNVLPGQFYMLKQDFPLLARPISVCEKGDDYVDFCYLVKGEGTKRLSVLQKGDSIFATGPIGNGFDVSFINKRKKVVVVSGGIGIAPFVELNKHLTTKVDYYCGFADVSYLTESFAPRDVLVSTVSGKEGHTGYITDIVYCGSYDLVVACGPEPFLKTLLSKARQSNTPTVVSMEKHMGCGIGACLVCTCATISGNKRCCVDGPVFKGEELVL